MSFFELQPILDKMLSVADNISDLNFSVGGLPGRDQRKAYAG